LRTVRDCLKQGSLPLCCDAQAGAVLGERFAEPYLVTLRVDQADGIQVDDVPTYGYEFHGVSFSALIVVSAISSTRLTSTIHALASEQAATL
jgi:hypothetical protein